MTDSTYRGNIGFFLPHLSDNDDIGTTYAHISDNNDNVMFRGYINNRDPGMNFSIGHHPNLCIIDESSTEGEVDIDTIISKLLSGDEELLGRMSRSFSKHDLELRHNRKWQKLEWFRKPKIQSDCKSLGRIWV